MRIRPSIRLFVAAIATSTALVVPAAPGFAAPCLICSSGGCHNVDVGFSACWYGSIGGHPTCALAGSCPGGAGSDDDDGIPLLRSSREAGSGGVAPAAVASETRLYWLTLPLDAAPHAGLGDRARVLRGVADASEPESFMRAVARSAGLPPGRLRVANAEALTGGSELVASFAAADGRGYTIAASPASRGTRVTLCRIDGRVAGDRLAGEVIEPGDVLLVPLHLQGEPCLMVLSVAPSFAMDAAGRGAEERLRRSFHDAGGRLARAGGHRGYQIDLLPSAVGCR